MIAAERVTISGAVPTIWADILRYGDEHDIDLSSLCDMIVCGGSAVPRSLMEKLQENVRRARRAGLGHDRDVAARRGLASRPHRIDGRHHGRDGLARDDRAGRSPAWNCASSTTWATRCRGTARASARSKSADRGSPRRVLPRRHAREVRRRLAAHRRRRSVNAEGFVQITDRAKDIIKSGGEWISSVELENHLMAHPDVVEASVIGVPDPRWEERPLACVVKKAGSSVTPEDLAAFLADRVAKWQVPERLASSTKCRRPRSGSSTRRCCARRHEKGDLVVESAGLRNDEPRPPRARRAASRPRRRRPWCCCATASPGSRCCSARRSSKLEVPRRRVGVPRRPHRSRRLCGRHERPRRGRAPCRGA